MKIEFKELGIGNRDGFCPHCGEFYGVKKLGEILSLEEVTDFRCRKCEKWIRGFGDFSLADDIEYHLIGISPVEDSSYTV
ncbi:MAG: hypothetical protein GQ559_08750 [Desulfobulbaceae bacterium]|nr:hypothetical protein [Desulfobulbaceae bacterium]